MIHAEVIGSPVSHSRSPAIHCFWLDRLGIEGRYSATEVAAEELAGFLDERGSVPGWRGCNVTMPLKQQAARLAPVLTGAACTIGAVNLLSCDSGSLIGHNVDGEGFMEALRPRLAGRARRAALIGSGGAARAIARALAQEGFSIDLLARDREKARVLLSELAPGHDNRALALAESLEAAREPSILVNATPLGMRGHAPLPLDLAPLRPDTLVCDIVYEPLTTPLLAAAAERRLETLDGLHMLIGQAALSFEILFGTKPPREADDALRKLLLR